MAQVGSAVLARRRAEPGGGARLLGLRRFLGWSWGCLEPGKLILGSLLDLFQKALHLARHQPLDLAPELARLGLAST